METLRFLYVSDIIIADATLWGQLVLPMLHLQAGSKSVCQQANITDLTWQTRAPITGPYSQVRHITINDHQGLEFAAVGRVIFNTENPDTNYRSGNELVIDYAAGWNFGPTKVGVVGYYLHQFTDDEGPSVAADGHRGKAFAIGPSLSYSFGQGSQASASWQHDIFAENRAQGDTMWLNFATKF